ERVEEVVDVVVVVGGVSGATEHAVLASRNSGPGVTEIYGTGPILEEGMMRNVVGGKIHITRLWADILSVVCSSRQTGPFALGCSVGIRDGQIEAAHERAPTQPLRAQQVADVLPAHLDISRARTHVTGGIEVAN